MGRSIWRLGRNEGLLALLMAGLIIMISSCATSSRQGGATHFTAEEGIELQLLDRSASDRVDAVKELLRQLNEDADVRARGALDDGMVIVIAHVGVREEPWEVPFHLVWPNPPDSDSVRLLSWAAIFKVDFTVAEIARRMALEKLESLIGRAIKSKSLHERIGFPSQG